MVASGGMVNWKVGLEPSLIAEPLHCGTAIKKLLELETLSFHAGSELDFGYLKHRATFGLPLHFEKLAVQWAYPLSPPKYQTSFPNRARGGN